SLSASRDRPQRGVAPELRFLGYALLALGLMYLDQRGGVLDRVRYGFEAAAYPLRIALQSPAAAWRWTQGIFEDRAVLQDENRRLREALRAQQLLAMRRESLERENAELRGLRVTLPAVAERWLPAQVIAYEADGRRQRIVVDRGARNGVAKGQAVVAGDGIVGQSLRVGPWSTEVSLLSDPEHGIPGQVARNGRRTLATGAGTPDTVVLPYLPLQSDIKVGDQLVSSGLGGVFPAGFPVAEVTEVKRDGGSPLAQVRARARAGIDRDRIVGFVWFSADHPAKPVDPAAADGGDPAAKSMPTAAPTPAPTAAPARATP
ncbi:MAG: rod shape-determining protein MreC, partial [Gammaproteobacteria bacterium]